MRLSHLTQELIADLARRLASFTHAPMTICLWGDLGAGKTTFARYFIQHLLISDEDIPSPTFTLIQSYETPKGEVWHCDLYRLETSYEVEELGLLEAFGQAICLMEWPERIKDYLPKNRLDIHLTIDLDQTRTVEMISHGAISIDSFIQDLAQYPLK